MTRPEQRPEGALIERALDRLDLSVRAAAKLADLSDTRLRHFIAGHEPLGSGNYREVTIRGRILARIAEALDISPDDLDAAGRQDAGDILRDRLSRGPQAPDLPHDEVWAQIDWVRQQPWPAAKKQEMINSLIELDRQAQEERRTGS